MISLRRFAPSRAAITRLGLLWAAVWLGAVTPLAADQLPSRGPVAAPLPPGKQAASLEIQRIFVPADQPETWMLKGLQPVPAEEFNALVKAARAHSPAPPSAAIDRAVYSAEIAGNQLVNGRFVWNIARREKNGGLLFLEPLNLAIADLTTAGHPAAWGTSADGRTALLVDANTTAVEGSWALAGRRRTQSVEFDLLLPPAAVSRLQLKIPAGQVLTASVGQITAPSSSSDGAAEWTVDLGSESQCRLSIAEAPASAPVAPLLFAESDLSYAIRDDGVQLQARFELDVAQGAIDSISFLVPSNVEVFSITYGLEANLPWTSTPEGDRTRVVVSLPTPLQGRSRPLRVQALAGFRPGQLWILPAPVLENAVPRSGQLHLKVRRPLLLKTFEVDGYRQTSISPEAPDGETFTFHQERPDARLAILADYAEVRLAAQTLAHVHLTPDQHTCRMQVDWTAESGLEFRTRYRVSDRWDVTSVSTRNGSNTRQPAHWEVTQTESGQVLVVESFEPVDRDHRLSIEIQARHRSRLAPERLELPVIVPLDCGSCEQVIALSQAESLSIALDHLVDVNTLEPGELPAALQEMPLWQSIASDNKPDAIRLLTFHAPASTATVAVRKTDNPTPAPDSTRAPATASAPAPVAADPPVSLKLDTHFAPRGGDDLHRAIVHVPRSKHDGFRFALPAPAQLVAVECDGRSVYPARDGAYYLVGFNSETPDHEIAIEYRNPSQAGSLQSRRSAVLPEISAAVVGFDWTITLPEAEQISRPPAGLVYNERLSNLHWTERLFGPLGRPAAARLFHPFSRSSWTSLWQPRGKTSVADARENAPPGFMMHHASAAAPPARLELETWNAAQASRTGWAALLAGLLFATATRLSSSRFAPRLRLWALFLCVVGACLLPDAYAMMAGGALSGLIIGTLIPPSLIKRERQQPAEGEEIFLGSTVTEEHPAVGAFGILLAAALALNATSAPAQEAADAPRVRPPALGRDTVLVPVGPDRQPSSKLPYVYASPELLAALREKANTDPRPRYLISSADYRLRIENGNSAQLEVRYVVLPLEQAPVRVSLPIENAFLTGSDACRVDGRPQAVLPAEDGSGILVDLPAAKTPAADQSSNDGPLPRFEIALVLRPRVEQADGSSLLEIGVPRVASGQLTLEGETTESASVRMDGKPVQMLAPGQSIPLGKASKLRVEWGSASKPSETAPALQASLVSTAEVRPTLTEFRCRVDYRVLSGSVSAVTWQLPRDFVLNRLEATDLLGTVNIVKGEAIELFVEFTDPQSGNFFVDATFVLPTRHSGPHTQVPLVPTLAAPNATVDVSSRRIGVLTTADYELAQAGDPEAYGTPLSPEAFLSGTADDAGFKKPRFAYETRGPQPLSFRVQPVLPMRKIVMQQEHVTVESERVRCRLQAEIELSGTEAFQHRLVVDPRWRIEKASVVESNAERLMRFSQLGDRVTLFLRDKTAGFQNVTLTATLDAAPPAEVQLPSFQFENAEPVPTTIVLSRKSDVSVALLDSVSLAPPANPPAQPVGDAIIVGTLSVPPGATPPRIRIAHQRARVRVDSLTLLEKNPADSESWSVATTLNLRDVPAPGSTLRLTMPPDLADNYTLEAGTARADAKAGDDGSVTLSLAWPETAAPPVAVTVVSPDVTATAGLWTVPRLRVVDAEDLDAYFAAPETDITPAPGSAERILPAELPAWAAEFLSSRGIMGNTAVYRAKSPLWKVIPEGTASDKTFHASLVHHQIWFDHGMLNGCTEIHFDSASKQALELVLPPRIQPRALFVDGTAAPVSVDRQPSDNNVPRRPTDRETTLLAHLPDGDVHSLVLWWNDPQPQTSGLFGRRVFELPHVKDLSSARTLLAIATPHDHLLVAPKGFARLKPLEYAADRMEGLLLAGDSPAPQPLALTMLRKLRAVFAPKLAAAESRGDARSDDQIRFANVLKRVERIEQNAPSASPPSATLAGLETMTGSVSEAVFGRLSADSAPVLSFWTLRRSLLAWTLTLFGAAIVAAALFRFRLGLHLDAVSRNLWVWAAFGLAWWLFLSPSALGLLIILAVAVLAARNRTGRSAQTAVQS